MTTFKHMNPTRKIAALLCAGAFVAAMPGTAFAAGNVISTDGGTATSTVTMTTLASSDLPNTPPYDYSVDQPIDVDGDGKITVTDLDDSANGGNGDGKFGTGDEWWHKAPIDIDRDGVIEVSDLDDALNDGNGNGSFGSGDYWYNYTPIDINLDGIIDGTDLDDPINGGNGDGKFGEGDKYYSSAGTSMNVTVPGTLPLTVNANGDTTATEKAKITNNSSAPVQVTSMKISSEGGWSLSDYAEDYHAMAVNSNKLGFSLDSIDGVAQNATNADNATSQELMKSKVQIASGGEANIAYSGKVSAVSEATTAKTIASIVFTVGWAQD